MKLRHIKDLV